MCSAAIALALFLASRIASVGDAIVGAISQLLSVEQLPDERDADPTDPPIPFITLRQMRYQTPIML
jgi:hypothetical protein